MPSLILISKLTDSTIIYYKPETGAMSPPIFLEVVRTQNSNRSSRWDSDVVENIPLATLGPRKLSVNHDYDLLSV